MSNLDSEKTNPVVIAIVLAVCTLLAYYPVLQGGFINYDDPSYVTANSHVKAGLSVESIGWAFSTFFFYNWHPLTWISHMLDIQIFGLNPLGHHLTSLLLHTGNSVLLFVLFRRMTGSTWKSAFVAALFALHPLHVESVAWVSERKDVLCTLFGLLATLAYVEYARSAGKGAYLLCAMLFMAGLMAKPMLITLPFVLLLLDYWPLKRLQPEETGHFLSAPSSHLILEKIPLVALSLVSTVVTFMAQKQGGALHNDNSLLQNAGNAAVSYVTYILNMFWPAKLAVYYPLHSAMLSSGTIALATLILIAVTGAVFYAGRRFPFLPVGWLWYLGTLVPVIGFIQVGEHALADRYTYIPLIGLFIILAWGGAALGERMRLPKTLLFGAALVILIACALLSNLQARKWHDSVTLFSHAVAVTENNDLAHKNLGAALANRGQFEEALAHVTESLRIKSEPREFVSQGWLYLKLGQNQQAAQSCRQALALAPNDDKGHFILGLASIGLKDYRAAIAEYEILRAFNSPYAIQLFDQLNSAGITAQSSSQPLEEERVRR
jgi:protein O-mannosyl-transferase